MMRILVIVFLVLSTFTTVYSQRQIDEDFLDAVQKKDIPRMNQLLSRGANINARSKINGYYALMYAINWPDLNLVKLLLDKGADVNIADDSGDTALIEAANNNGPVYTAIIKLLLARGADIHANHDEAIFYAAENAEPEVIRLLLSRGAPVNGRDKDRDHNTVLMHATDGGSLQTVEMLLAAGADVKSVNEQGETALMHAATVDHRYSPSQRLPMIELLLKRGADINTADKTGKTALLHSVKQYMSEAGGVISHPEVVKLLLDRGANVNAVDLNGDNALITATGVYHGSLETVRLLLEKGINLNTQNKKGVSALMVAAQVGKPEVVNVFLDHGADLNLKDSDGETALDYAIASGEIELAKSLFGRSAKSKNDYKSEADVLKSVTNAALLEAAARNKLDEVKKQLAAGADINARSKSGATPLIFAVQYSYGDQGVANYLIDNGADLNAVDGNGNTALMIAIERNNSEAAMTLITRSAALYPRNKDGQTALHIASAGLRPKVVEALLTAKPTVTASSAGVDVRGLDVNEPDGSGRTPLMLAADNEGFVPDDVMDVLLAKGAKIDEQDPKGDTALMLSARQGNMSGVEYLVNKRANLNLKNKAGETALKLARKIHENKLIINADLVEEKVVATLVSAGAKE